MSLAIPTTDSSVAWGLKPPNLQHKLEKVVKYKASRYIQNAPMLCDKDVARLTFAGFSSNTDHGRNIDDIQDVQVSGKTEILQ